MTHKCIRYISGCAHHVPLPRGSLCPTKCVGLTCEESVESPGDIPPGQSLGLTRAKGKEMLTKLGVTITKTAQEGEIEQQSSRMLFFMLFF